MTIYLNSMTRDLQEFIRSNFKGYSYDGLLIGSLDEFFEQDTIDETFVYFKTHDNTLVKFFNFEEKINNFNHAIVYKRLLNRHENTYDVKALFNICLKAKLIPSDSVLYSKKMEDRYSSYFDEVSIVTNSITLPKDIELAKCIRDSIGDAIKYNDSSLSMDYGFAMILNYAYMYGLKEVPISKMKYYHIDYNTLSKMLKAIGVKTKKVNNARCWVINPRGYKDDFLN